MIQRTLVLAVLLAGCAGPGEAAVTVKNTVNANASPEAIQLDPAAVQRFNVRHPEGIGAAVRGDGVMPAQPAVLAPSVTGATRSPVDPSTTLQNEERALRQAAHFAGPLPATGMRESATTDTHGGLTR